MQRSAYSVGKTDAVLSLARSLCRDGDTYQALNILRLALELGLITASDFDYITAELGLKPTPGDMYDAVVTIVGNLTRENHRDAAAEYTLIAAQESGLLSNRECNQIATSFGLALQWEE
jgi:hypothetical protein